MSWVLEASWEHCPGWPPLGWRSIEALGQAVFPTPWAGHPDPLRSTQTFPLEGSAGLLVVLKAPAHALQAGEHTCGNRGSFSRCSPGVTSLWTPT